MSQGSDTMDLVVSRYDESANSIASYIRPILNMTPLSGLQHASLSTAPAKMNQKDSATTCDIT